MSQIGHLGSSALLLPASLLLASILAGVGRGRDAMALVVALFCVVLSVFGAKLAFYPCAGDAAAVESPSGHASFATMFYGIVVLVLSVGRSLPVRLFLFATAAVLIALIGVSRVETFAHTVPEVAVGIGLGLLPLAAFAILRAPPQPVHIPLRIALMALPLVVAGAVVILLLARHWTPEPFIDAGARRLDALLHACS